MSGNNDNIKNATKIKEFIKELVKKLKMKAVGEPIVKNFGTGIHAGWSAIQLITTSSITFHAVNKNKSAYLDVFSCKDYDQETVLDLVKTTFEPNKIKHKFMYRDAPK